MEEIFVPLAFFASVVLILYIYYTNRNKERMALIEKGIDASIFKSPRAASMYTFKIGFFFIGLGVGILMGSIIAATTRLQEETAYFSMIFLFGGASLIIYHLLENKLIQRDSKSNEKVE